MPKFEKQPKYDKDGNIIGYKYLIDDSEQTKEVFESLYSDETIKKDNIQPIDFSEFKFNIPQQNNEDNSDEEFDTLYDFAETLQEVDIEEAMQMIEENLNMAATAGFLQGQCFAFKQAKKAMAQTYREASNELDKYLVENDIDDEDDEE